jgi:hypothetical protein
VIVSRQERLDAFGLVAGLVVVFAIDSRFPLGVATGMLYVPLLFVCQPPHRRRWLIPVTALSTALILLDVALGIGGTIGPAWVYLTNRGGSIGVLWTIALQLRRSFRLEAAHDAAVEEAAALAERRVLGGLLPICASCKRIQRSNDVWQSLEAYIQAHSEASFSHGLCPSCVASLYPELPPMQ